MEKSESQTERELPDHLYHYTSIKGLEGILENRCLWASSINYLNDTQEIRYAISILNKLFDKRKGAYPESPFFRMAIVPPKQEILLNKNEALRRLFDFLPGFLSELLIERFQVFVFSLSAERDLLSQWRGYCPAEGGYSVGFRRDLLIEASKRHNFHLQECIYEESKQEAMIDKEISKLTDDFLKEWPDSKKVPLPAVHEIIYKIGTNFCIEFTKTAALIKHKAFEEEREWRIISGLILPKGWEFRAGKSILIPYIRIKFGISEPFPFDKIIVGPGPDQSLAAKSLEIYAISKDLKIEIEASDIPYREL